MEETNYDESLEESNEVFDARDAMVKAKAIAQVLNESRRAESVGNLHGSYSPPKSRQSNHARQQRVLTSTTPGPKQAETMTDTNSNQLMGLKRRKSRPTPEMTREDSQKVKEVFGSKFFEENVTEIAKSSHSQSKKMT